MAQQDPTTRGNGSGEAGDQPQVAPIAQYIKDLSVESPSSPQSFQWQVQPQLEVQFNIAVNNITDEVHEVVLKIDVAARSENGVHFLIDLSYAGLYGIRNLPEDALGAYLLVEAPSLLFPFARQIIAEASQNTGFPPLLLDPIDFGSAYMSQLQAQQGQQQPQDESGGEPTAESAETPATSDEEQPQ